MERSFPYYRKIWNYGNIELFIYLSFDVARGVLDENCNHALISPSSLDSSSLARLAQTPFALLYQARINKTTRHEENFSSCRAASRDLKFITSRFLRNYARRHLPLGISASEKCKGVRNGVRDIRVCDIRDTTMSLDSSKAYRERMSHMKANGSLSLPPCSLPL